ncbi:MAG: hypothetical protein LCH30_06665 [Proteobacteria bacterium]|nr:hypothetical protein [Pseudomonadota bacterium]
MPGIIDHKKLVEKRWSSMFKPIQAHKQKSKVQEDASQDKAQIVEADLFDYFFSLPIDIIFIPACAFDFLANLVDLLIISIKYLDSYAFHGINPKLSVDDLIDLNNDRLNYKENLKEAALQAVFSLVALFNPVVDLISFILTRPVASLIEYASSYNNKEQTNLGINP